MRQGEKIAGLAGWVLASFAAGWFGSRFTAPEWYQALQRPEWSPPPAVFGPVWSALYLAMGIAAWVVWRREGFRGAPVALGLWIAQLVLNAAWSWIFFGRREMGLAFAEIVALWLVILATIVAFWRISRAAGILLLPYLAWVTFAAVLNYTLWRMN